MQDASDATTTAATNSEKQTEAESSGLLMRTLWLVGSYLLVMGLIVVAQS